jgi:hypothetical protein
MSEIKHTFQAGKMNKDLDERLVPNGEYRDAFNIEVRTSDGDDAGTVQNLHGNIERLFNSANNANPTNSWKMQVDGITPIPSSMVGSIANERTNMSYFFVAAPSTIISGVPDETKLFKDMIVEYNNVTKRLKPVVIDIFEVHSNNIGALASGTVTSNTMDVDAATIAVLKPGMTIKTISGSNTQMLSNQGDDYDMSLLPVIKSINSNTITFDRMLTIDFGNIDYWVFKAHGVLNFHRPGDLGKKDITGINIIDGMLLWVDNHSEPKKVNINRCILGSHNSFDLNTKLMITDPSSQQGTLTNISNIDTENFGDLKEEHITVIRRAPKSAPKLLMSNNTRGISLDITGVCEATFVDASGAQYEPGIIVSDVSVSSITLFVGDIVTLNNVQVTGQPQEVRAIVHAIQSDGAYELEIITMSTDVSALNLIWNIKLSQEKPLFELKLGRFSYRYLYQDGEYSSFAPWSEIAFLPSAFDYIPKKGYNLGMVNELRDLKITNFIVNNGLRPDDVTAVDILYKNTESPNVYIVKTIKRGLDPEWIDSNQYSGSHSGVMQVTSEMIYRTLPSSQLLRAWDNVPRVAMAQEVTGNRVVYANYLQNYSIHKPISVYPELLVNAHANIFPSDGKEELEYMGRKSIKSIRRYKIGVVYGDKYGRETPVMGIGGNIGRHGGTTVPSDVYNPKENSDAMTKLAATQHWVEGNDSVTPPSWINYFKYYVKETTNEYYNLVMDRWYNAEDGNIWLSFQSSDRNKLNEPDEYNKINGTYITLKNKHGSNIAVDDEARYKILAIENEAPDYIKTTRKILGSLPIGSTDNSLGADLESAMFVTFSSTAWNTMFNEIKFEGIGYARIRGVLGGQFAYTEWVKVSRMNDATHTVNVIKPFGIGADMGAQLGVGATYTLEMKDDVVENRPEFDGRFFVKVYKDAVLAENVLGTTDDSLSYNTVDSFSFKMIYGQNNHPSSSGPKSSNTWGSGSFGHFQSGSPNNSSDGANNFGKCGANGKTKDFWRSFGSNTWFIDKARKSYAHAQGADHQRKKGMWHDSSHGVSGVNSIHFSIRRLNAGSGDSALFKTVMTTIGTLFRFDGDPNPEAVYEVRPGSGATFTTYNDYGNWDKSSWGCNGYDTSNGSTQRHTFRCNFAKASNPSEGLVASVWDPRGEILHNGRGTAAKILIVKPSFALTENIEHAQGNAIWETEPTKDVGLDLYYEATSAIPMIIDDSSNELFAPINSMVTVVRPGVGYMNLGGTSFLQAIDRDIITVYNGLSPNTNLLVGDLIRFTRPDGTVTESKILNSWSNPAAGEYVASTTSTVTYSAMTGVGSDDLGVQYFGVIDSDIVYGTQVTSTEVTIPDNTFVVAGMNEYSNILTLSNPIATSGQFNLVFTFPTGSGHYRIDRNVYNYRTELPWFNCYSFGNGLESDRIRDDYNAPTIDNGVKVSTTLEDYGEERRANGLIYSGIYNSTSSVNNLNEFNMAEAITKDLNPSYGSIQALKSRDTNVVAFCEDKVLKILSNKDALFNSDGSKNLTASSNVLGDAIGFSGDYGISSNPESLAVDGYRMYFTDQQRNKVLRLSQDGLTPISDIGMTSWFRDNLKPATRLVGSVDEIKGEYNLSLIHKPDYKTNHNPTVADKTLSFSEKSKGWVSFKSFVFETGLSINDEYLTAREGRVWSHHDKTVNANTFYGNFANSTIDILFNDNPSSIKSFGSMNYEGSQAKITSDVSGANSDYYNLSDKDGWFISSFNTNEQECDRIEFVEREGKWFNYIKGATTTLKNLDTSEFSVQGLGLAVASNYAPSVFTLTITEDGE